MKIKTIESSGRLRSQLQAKLTESLTKRRGRSKPLFPIKNISESLQAIGRSRKAFQSNGESSKQPRQSKILDTSNMKNEPEEPKENGVTEGQSPPKATDELSVMVSNSETKKEFYTCTVCERMYSFKSHLSRHMKTHKHSRPYKCNLCIASFLDGNMLKQHLVTHSGLPISCAECPRKFYSRGDHNRHSCVVRQDKSFQCKDKEDGEIEAQQSDEGLPTETYDDSSYEVVQDSSEQKRYPNNLQNNLEDYEIFGKYISNRLRKLPPMMRIHAEKLMNDILYEAQLNNLSKQTMLVTNASPNSGAGRGHNRRFGPDNLVDLPIDSGMF